MIQPFAPLRRVLRRIRGRAHPRLDAAPEITAQWTLVLPRIKVAAARSSSGDYIACRRSLAAVVAIYGAAV